MFFEKPTQVKFWEDGAQEFYYGIAYRDEAICGCCGGVIEISEILVNKPDGIIVLPFWTNIDECIGEHNEA